MRIAMIGTGYVGLVSGVCFSAFGHDVVCVDKDASKIERLENGEIPIYEPGLDTLLSKNVEAGRLSFTLDLASAIEGAEAVFIGVGTPPRRGDGHATPPSRCTPSRWSTGRTRCRSRRSRARPRGQRVNAPRRS